MSENTHEDDELLFEELSKIAATLEEDIEIAKATQESLVELKNEDFWPIFDEYYGSAVVGEIHVPDLETDIKKAQGPCWPGYKQVGMKKGKSGKLVPNCVPIEGKSEEQEAETKAAKKKLKNPKGGLTAAGRAYFKRKEGANLKPGVKGPADTPEKMRRKGSFLTRFFTNPSGPMVDDKGRATRLALSAAAWGERVPRNAQDAAALAAKGRRLLSRYASTKKKSEEISELEYKAALGSTIGGSTIGQSSGASSAAAGEAIDKDGDGLVFDGTPQETRKPKKYEKLPNEFTEKRRRKFVRDELKKRGITPTRGNQIQTEEFDDGDGKIRLEDMVYGRDDKEKLARSDAREAFNRDEDRKRFVRNQLRKAGITPTAKGSDRSDAERAARRAARAEYDRRERAGAPKPKLGTPPKPKPSYPPGYEPGKPADRYPDPAGYKPGKPADRYPQAQKPGVRFPTADDAKKVNERKLTQAKKKITRPPERTQPRPPKQTLPKVVDRNKKPEQGRITGPKFPGQDKIMELLKDSQG